MANYTKKLVHGTLIVLIITLLGAFLGYIIRIVLARNLSVEGFGLFYAVFTFILFFTLIRTLGLNQALLKFIPKFLVQKRFDKIKSSITFVLIATFVSSGIFSLIFLIFSKFLTFNYFKSESAYLTLIILTAYFLISNFIDFFSRIFQSFQKPFLFSLRNLLPNLIVFLFILLFIKSFGILAPSLAYLVAAIITSLVFFFLMLKIFPFFKYKTTLTKPLIKKFMIFGMPVMLTLLGGTIIGYIDTLILTFFRTLSEVGVYNAILPTALVLHIFGLAIANVLFPMVSELHERKLKEKLVNGLKKILKYSFFLILPIGLILLIFPKLFLNLFFGKEYLAGALAMQILVIGAILYAVAAITSVVISGLGHPKKVTKIVLFAALVNIIGNFILIPFFGINGAAIATFLSYLIILILTSLSLSKLIDLNIPWKPWIITFICGFIFVLIIYILKTILSLNLWLELIITVITAGVIYVALCYLFKVIDINEIKNILYMVSKKQ